MKATFTHSLGSPVFVVQGDNNDLARIFGGTYLKQHNVWMYPAYPPSLENVCNDFQVLGIEYDERAQNYLDQLHTLKHYQQIVEQEPVLGPFPNYGHQNKGIAELLYNYRWVLRWDMGTGKTKIAVEALIKLRLKTLIIGPKISVDNWVEEINTHSNNTLRPLILRETTRKRKLKTLEKAINEKYDILLASYDTARLYGNMMLSPKILKVINHSRLPIPKMIQKLLLGLSAKDALEIIEEYQRLTPLVSIKKRIQSMPKDLCIQDFPYEIIILDESHRVKNIRAKQTKVVSELCKKASRRYLLTGTISMGNPLDLYPQLNALAKYICPESYFSFKKKFCDISPLNEHIVTGYKNLHILNQRLQLFSSERRIEDCVDLPGIHDINISYKLTPEQLGDYNALIERKTLDFGELGILEDLNGAVRNNKLLQICSGFLYVRNTLANQICDTCTHVMDCVVEDIQPGTKRCTRYEELKNLIKTNTLRYPKNPKLSTLEDLLKDLLASPEEKVVIWANMDAEMEDIAQLLKTQGLPFVQVDGSTTSRIKTLAKEFDENPHCRVYLGQESTGISINLVAARYAIYYSRSWSLEHWLQSRAREYRIGQTRKAVVYRLCASQSIEIQQLIALDNRQDIASMLTDKVDCAVCVCYINCVKNKVVPWSKGCVYKSKIDRETVTPEVIKRGNSY